MAQTEQRLPRLTLPTRFEKLEREAQKEKIDISSLIFRVDKPASRIENLLRQATDNGLGRFEFFLGKSGSGKTTFLSTLPKFFTGAHVSFIPPTLPLNDVVSHIKQKQEKSPDINVFIIHQRDNPRDVAEAQIRAFFEDLRVFFREQNGNIVLIWPITDAQAATNMGHIAWDVGSDSIVDLQGGVYHFEGLPKEQFYDVADTTTRALNQGKSLEDFGLTRAVTLQLIVDSPTIAQFYNRLSESSSELNQKYQSILQKRVVPHVWVLLAGEENNAIGLTVASLTQGTQKRIDIERLCEYLDRPDGSAAYLADWKERRDSIAHLMRLLDVRLLDLPPNDALAAVRAFGEEELKNKLKKPNGSVADAIQAIKNTRFYHLLTGASAGVQQLRQTRDDTMQEFTRLQREAARQDKLINKALARALEAAFKEDAILATVDAERRGLSGSRLKPDIKVDINDMIICLEPTWRTTGRGIPNEIKDQQNTLTTGHIQKYLLEKILEYVKDLGL